MCKEGNAFGGEHSDMAGQEDLERKIAEISIAVQRPMDMIRDRVGYYRAMFGGDGRMMKTRLKWQTVYIVHCEEVGCSLDFRCAQVAAEHMGIPIILESRVVEGTPVRMHLCGKVSKKMIRPLA